MKYFSVSTSLPHGLFTFVTVAAVVTLLAMPGTAVGQIYVTNSTLSGGFATPGQNFVGEYNAATGAAVNPALVSKLNATWGLALSASGTDLYIVSQNDIHGDPDSGTIGDYNALTGAVKNAALISALNAPGGIAASGSYLFVLVGGGIGEYNATTGGPAVATLPIVPFAQAIAAETDPSGSGSTLLFVTSFVAAAGAGASTGSIYEFTVSPTGLVTSSSRPLFAGLTSPTGIAVSGSALYVVRSTGATTEPIDEYTFSTSATGVVTAGTSTPSFIAGIAGTPTYLAVSGSNLLVTLAGTPPGTPGTSGSGMIGEYNTATGATVTPFPLVKGLTDPIGIAVVGPAAYHCEEYVTFTDSAGHTGLELMTTVSVSGANPWSACNAATVTSFNNNAAWSLPAQVCKSYTGHPDTFSRNFTGSPRTVYAINRLQEISQKPQLYNKVAGYQVNCSLGTVVGTPTLENAVVSGILPF
jgi:hypothetical protein